jgi:hypothetical protein
MRETKKARGRSSAQAQNPFGVQKISLGRISASGCASWGASPVPEWSPPTLEESRRTTTLLLRRSSQSMQPHVRLTGRTAPVVRRRTLPFSKAIQISTVLQSWVSIIGVEIVDNRPNQLIIANLPDCNYQVVVPAPVARRTDVGVPSVEILP